VTSTAIGDHVAAPEVPRPVPRWSPPELLPVLLVLAFGVVLLLPGHGLWYDELFTAEVGRLPLRELFSAVVEGRGTTSYLADVPPSYNAPYYVVVHAWMALPGLGSDTSLRVLSLLATTGGLALVTRAVSRLAGRATGVLAGVVLAASPLLLVQSVEARSYGLAVLATGGAALGLARWLQEAPRGLLLLGLAGAGMGLAHWYAVTTLAAFVAAALVLQGRRALPVLLVGAAAAVPTALLVGVNLLSGNGSRNADHLPDTGGRLSRLALEAWTGGQSRLLVVVLVLAAVAGFRARGVRVVGLCWAVVPLVLLTGAELIHPVYSSRYLLTGLLGVGVLAAAGALAVPRAARIPAAALLLACTLLVSAPLTHRHPRERSDDVVRALAQLQRPGEPVVAADRRSATGLDHYVRVLVPRLRPDVVLPPDDAPPGAGRVWRVRRVVDGVPGPTDDDDILRSRGLWVTDERDFPGSRTHLVIQLWER
jgi:mannosyltransferase